MIREIQDEILRLKKEQDVCILAHSYVAREISEVADFVGDSYGLSVQAMSAPQKTVIMCGVRFMAETCKILSPEKKVYLANPVAGCPMAEQMDKDLIGAWKKANPDYTVVAYINTTAELKTICDVCCTSSSAVQIVNNLDTDKILFIPDCNLGQFVAEQCPDKDIKLLQGGCPIHAAVPKRAVDEARAHAACVRDVIGGAARTRLFANIALIIQRHRHACHVIALLQQQHRTRRAVHAAAHGCENLFLHSMVLSSKRTAPLP